MPTIAALVFVLLLAALVGWAWRQRALAARRARLAEIELARAQMSSVAADSANLLAVTLLAIQSAEQALGTEPDVAKACLDDAISASRSVAGLFDAARSYAIRNEVDASTAEGAARFAVSLSRATGARIAIQGATSGLGLEGPCTEAIELFHLALRRLAARPDSSGYTTLALHGQEIHVSRPAAGPVALDDLMVRASQLGWSVRLREHDGIQELTCRAEPLPEEVAPAPVPAHLH